MSRCGVWAFCGLTLVMIIFTRTQFRAAILEPIRLPLHSHRGEVLGGNWVKNPLQLRVIS
jgi:hypothetical protein